MAKAAKQASIIDEAIINKIHIIRGQKVMLDQDLAELYGVETKRLKEQVNRNRSRFPAHFMFELTLEETNSLRSQNAIIKRGAHTKYAAYAFTEHGVLFAAVKRLLIPPEQEKRRRIGFRQQHQKD